MILPASKQRLIDHTVSLLEASNCINLLITGKFAQAVLHFFKVKVKQKLHRNMFRTVNCIISFVRENRYFLNWMPCFYFQTRPHASSVIFAHGYVRFCDRVNKLQWLSSVLFWSRFGYFIVSFDLLQWTKETLFTLLRSCFLSWSAKRATYFREKVCNCFSFRCLRERSTVLSSLAGNLTWTKHLVVRKSYV